MIRYVPSYYIVELNDKIMAKDKMYLVKVNGRNLGVAGSISKAMQMAPGASAPSYQSVARELKNYGSSTWAAMFHRPSHKGRIEDVTVSIKKLLFNPSPGYCYELVDQFIETDKMLSEKGLNFKEVDSWT